MIDGLEREYVREVMIDGLDKGVGREEVVGGECQC